MHDLAKTMTGGEFAHDNGDGQIQYAGFWIRVGAGIIDWLLVLATVCVAPAILLFSNNFAHMEAGESTPNFLVDRALPDVQVIPSTQSPINSPGFPSLHARNPSWVIPSTHPSINTPNVQFSPSTNKLFINGALVDADDDDAILRAEPYMHRQRYNPPTGIWDWIDIGASGYSQIQQQIINPSTERLFKKNIGLGIDSMQLFTGRGLQLIGAKKLGQNIIGRNIDQLRQKRPYQRRFVNIGDNANRGVVDWFVANIAQQLLYIFGAIAVSILFWIHRQATPGKMAVRVKIADARSGGKPSTLQCIGRYIAYCPSFICFGIGILWVAFDAHKQGWHDKLAGTVVIRETPRG